METARLFFILEVVFGSLSDQEFAINLNSF